MLFSFFFASYKAFDYKNLYVKSNNNNDALEIRLTDALVQQKYTEVTLNNVLGNISITNSSFDDVKRPFWYKIYDEKSDSFRMVYLNKRYEEVFNVDRMTYMGELDYKIHGSELATEYERFDRLALKSDKPINAIEHGVDDTSLKVLKWRVDKPDGTILIYGLVTEYID